MNTYLQVVVAIVLVFCMFSQSVLYQRMMVFESNQSNITEKVFLPDLQENEFTYIPDTQDTVKPEVLQKGILPDGYRVVTDGQGEYRFIDDDDYMTTHPYDSYGDAIKGAVNWYRFQLKTNSQEWTDVQ